MERIDRNAGRSRRGGSGPELVVTFDINGTAHAVVSRRPDERPEPPQPEAEAALSPEVIRRWLACIAVALLGLGLTQPGEAVEPATFAAVDLQS